jgi:hypothetical protein
MVSQQSLCEHVAFANLEPILAKGRAGFEPLLCPAHTKARVHLIVHIGLSDAFLVDICALTLEVRARS